MAGELFIRAAAISVICTSYLSSISYTTKMAAATNFRATLYDLKFEGTEHTISPFVTRVK